MHAQNTLFGPRRTVSVFNPDFSSPCMSGISLNKAMTMENINMKAVANSNDFSLPINCSTVMVLLERIDGIWQNFMWKKNPN